jgi:hemerythrin-like domain-containing protein
MTYWTTALPSATLLRCGSCSAEQQTPYFPQRCGVWDGETMTDLSELGKILHEEHFRIIMLLCDLEHRITGEAALRPIDPQCEADRGHLRELLFSLDQIVDHNTFEEIELFPIICAHGEEELAALLVDEHDAIGPLAKHLRAIALQILEVGISAQRWHDFRAVASELVSGMMFHLQKEEMTVVQKLARFLDAPADHRLAVKHLAERPPIRSLPQAASGCSGAPEHHV